MVSKSATNFDFRDPKFDQAQIEITVPTSRNISDIKLQLIKSFQMKSKHKSDITGCVILPNGNLLVANHTEEKKLIEYSETGEHIRDIQVSGEPFAIAVIDLNRIDVRMACGKYIPCGPCTFDDVTKDARRWCTDCEEGLCEDCENIHRRSKASRNHKVITIDDYQKIENVSISQVCEQHGENLEWFCKSHDEVLCVVCVPSKHKACSDVIPINVNAANARQSSALSNLEDTIEKTLSNVKQCIRNRESATKELEKQELEVKTMVLETKAKINDHLDKLQEKLLHELRSTVQTCKSKYTKILRKLESTEEMLKKLRDQTLHMKQFSSDVQVFLGIRQVNRQLVHEVESIKTEIGAAKDYELKVSIDSLIVKLSNEVEEFGKIMVSETATNLDIRDSKFDQAQIEINVPNSRNIFDIKLQLIKSFQMTSEHKLNVSGCLVLPNGNLLMANATKEYHLKEYNDRGEHIRDIRVSDQPYAIAMIDFDRIVVSYGGALFIEIRHINTFNVEKKIQFKKNFTGFRMNSEKNIPCGPCLFDDVTRMQESGVLTVKKEYVKIVKTFIENHDEVLYVVCVPSNHKTCSDVIPISVNSANSRQSTALSDLEESIDGTLSNLKQCIKNRESAPNEIENQEIAVKTMILETRMNINYHLDRLQEKCLHELRLTSQTCISKYMEIVQKLKSKEELLTELKEQTIHMKQFSSDIQVFLGTLQMNKRIESEIKSIKSELCSAKDYKLKVAFHTLIEKLNEAEEFGK
ncbi:unnamed protein product [Mytilus edulis]|uniref:B box-type domain-containing protein n=1 Tax=Mytilus edulis TaxID=6550 RepID=A0A8S3TK32_MYTED|nr:unnamed protein product [Mytilus edulis]